jgi:hypothetical protein
VTSAPAKLVGFTKSAKDKKRAPSVGAFRRNSPRANYGHSDPNATRLAYDAVPIGYCAVRML